VNAPGSPPPPPPPPGAPAGRHPLDDLAAYALDALENAERIAVDDHLAGCAGCRAELAGHHETLAALTLDEPPPTALWQRIAVDIGAPDLADPTLGPSTPVEPSTLAVVAAAAPAGAAEPAASGGGSGDNVVPFRSRGPAHAAGGARRRGVSRWLPAAAVAVAAAALAVVGLDMRSTDDGADTVDELAQRAEQDGETLGTLADGSGQPVARVVADGGTSYVVLDRLGPTPEGRAYQLWSTKPDTAPVSLGMLGNGRTEAAAVEIPPGATELAISEEPEAGVTAPTGAIVGAGPIQPA
jgi:anti-sigma-K factor RskA